MNTISQVRKRWRINWPIVRHIQTTYWIKMKNKFIYYYPFIQSGWVRKSIQYKESNEFSRRDERKKSM
jgi:hypothetical protein